MSKPTILKWLIFLLFWFASTANAIDSVDILPAQQAFQLGSRSNKVDRVVISWDIANGYYLYRNKFKLVSLSPGIKVEEPQFPPGYTKQDKFFGEVEIYKSHLEIELPLKRSDLKSTTLLLDVHYQGCADAGVCYMPIQQSLSIALSDKKFDWWGIFSVSDPLAPFTSEHDNIAASLGHRSSGLIILVFFGFGVLLAFTPCVFPMIPILSGIIAGQGSKLTTIRAFVLSLSYVLASAFTYTVFGILAGFFGSNLQIFFQDPRVIVLFSAIFVLLASSMFGCFHVQIPSYLQTKLVLISFRQQRGNILGAGMMGVLSALAVGPCVTAPLAGALIYIGQSGDAITGGLALFSLGIGMGMPLLVIGTSAGKWLPKTGTWINATKAIFGMGLLAVAVWLLGRILPPLITLLLWSALLIMPLLYLSWKKLWKGLLLVAFTYTVFLLVGVATHTQRDAMQLLCVSAIVCEAPTSLLFQKVSSSEELQQALATAKAQGRWLMLDFYADWCASCKEMALYTFNDPRIKQALAPIVLVQADITQNLKSDQILLQRFKLIGPPAILFFGPEQQERKAFRVIGYMNADNFLKVIKNALGDIQK